MKIGEVTPDATGKGVEPCEAKLFTELRGKETGQWGSLSGCTGEVAAAWLPQRARAFRV